MKELKSERNKSSAVENKHTDGHQKAIKERQKRPDMQFYVPRALRGVKNKTVPLEGVYTESLQQQDGKKTSQESSVENLANSPDNLLSASSEDKHKKNSVNTRLKSKGIKNESDNACALPTDETVTEYATTQFATSSNAAINKILTVASNYPLSKTDDPQKLQNSSSGCMETVMPCNSNCTEVVEVADNANVVVSENVTENIEDFIIIKNMSSSIGFKKEETDSPVNSFPSKNVDSKPNCNVLENVLCSGLDTKSEFSSTATSDMDSLNISDKSDEMHASSKTTESNNTLPKEKDDSWESMFDDDGECLDSNLVKELSSVTGKIQVRAAKNSYADFQPVSEIVPQEYDNIVELYDFPREFVTQDLVSAFSIFQQSSFSIKWVDDCHALAIFTSPTLANQALQMKHPFMKVRPLSEGIKESKTKARWCANHSEPQKPRPATSAVLARRLVSGALGLRVQATKEQRDHERSVLKEAKEKRRLKAKQKEAIWDGSVE
ncbi:Coiled-coil domain-containing protein R3HCC1L [Argiope bruennichi]|nr:Coiled-coil domain-containing protein R3HCC1L [Argiope bruennichi]